jgi:hypothetical protein
MNTHYIGTSDPHFIAGVRLFNQGHYWHAHEQWEVRWLAAHEPERTFFKGLIQAAAALVHWQKNNPRGLHRNWVKARPRLVAVLPLVPGLDLPALITAMDGFVRAEGRAAPPCIRLQPVAGIGQSAGEQDSAAGPS